VVGDLVQIVPVGGLGRADEPPAPNVVPLSSWWSLSSPPAQEPVGLRRLQAFVAQYSTFY